MVSGDGGTSSPFTISAVAAPLVVGAGDCITLSGDGSAGAPLVADPVVDPDPANLLVCGPDGLSVAGGGAGTVTAGCGLSGDGSDGEPLQVATREWVYPCSLDEVAGGVFCDSTGTLRSDPRTRVSYWADSGNVSVPATAVPTAAEALVETHPLTITNPDTCRPAISFVTGSIDIDFNLPANSYASSGIGTDDMQGLANRGSSTATRVHTQVSKQWRVTVPAGESVVVPLEVYMGDGTGGATYTRIQWSMTALVISV